MLNPVNAVQIQIQTKQPITNGNDNSNGFARSDESEDNQFNNILNREVAEKKSSQATEPTANAANDTVSEPGETTSTKQDADDKTDINDTLNAANTTNLTNEPIQSAPQTINQVIPNQTPPNLVSEDKSDIEIIPPLQPTTIVAHSSNQINLLEKTLNLGQSTNPASAISPFQPGTRQGSNMNFLESNRLWQPLQTADSADRGKILPFSIETDKEMLTRLNEPNALFSEDTDATYQSALNNITSTIAKSTAQTAAPHNLNLESQIGQPKWNGDFAQKVVWLATQQNQVAELRLNPAHLGPVEIMLSLTQENGTQASAQFVSPHLAVREAIESALPRLRELMAESGIQLGDVMVGAESFQRQEQGQQHAHHFAKGIYSLNTTEDLDSSSEMKIISNRHHGIVNTFA